MDSDLTSLTAHPDESTVRKLTRRLGSELVDDLTREVVKLAVKERGYKVRAMRCDSTVQESDVRYPTDCGLASDAVKVLARAAGKLRAAIPGLTRKVRNRSRAAGRRIRELIRGLARRTGDAKQEVQRLTEEVAELAKASLGQARRLLDEAKQAVTSLGRSSQRRAARAIAELEQMIGLSDKVVEQIRKRFAGAQIADRLVSLFDPDARPIRKGKKSKPNQFGCMTQYAELTANTRRGARGLLVPPKVAIGSAHEDSLLPETVAEVLALDLRPPEAVFDRGFTAKATLAAMDRLGSNVFIAGSAQNKGSRRTRKRLASHRVGCEEDHPAAKNCDPLVYDSWFLARVYNWTKIGRFKARTNAPSMPKVNMDDKDPATGGQAGLAIPARSADDAGRG